MSSNLIARLIIEAGVCPEALAVVSGGAAELENRDWPSSRRRNKTISTLEGTQKDLEGLLKNSEDEDYTETWSRPLKNHLNTIKNPKAGVLKP